VTTTIRSGKTAERTEPEACDPNRTAVWRLPEWARRMAHHWVARPDELGIVDRGRPHGPRCATTTLAAVDAALISLSTRKALGIAVRRESLVFLGASILHGLMGRPPTDGRRRSSRESMRCGPRDLAVPRRSPILHRSALAGGFRGRGRRFSAAGETPETKDCLKAAFETPISESEKATSMSADMYCQTAGYRGPRGNEKGPVQRVPRIATRGAEPG
jgi:hypothetical protein